MRDSLIKLMPWMGGKGQLMWAIQMLLPIHYKTLVDVFGGSGIITLNTAVPKGCLQIYNDLNHDLYNLLFCVKHRPTVRRVEGTELLELLALCFEQDATHEAFDLIDGAHWLTAEMEEENADFES